VFVGGELLPLFFFVLSPPHHKSTPRDSPVSRLRLRGLWGRWDWRYPGGGAGKVIRPAGVRHVITSKR
jgi:hypothetical protein